MSETRRKELLIVISIILIIAAIAILKLTQGRWETFVAAGSEAYQEGDYAEAEKSWLAALKEAETFGPEDSVSAASLNNYLGLLYKTQGKYAEAEPLCRRSLAIYERALDPSTPTWPGS